MINVNVDVCVCTNCVMNGSVDIIDAIESLSLLKGIDHENINIELSTHKLIGKETHTNESPVIFINETKYTKANPQTAMSKILACIIEKGTN